MGTHFVAPPSGLAWVNAVSAWFKRCGGAGVDLFFVLSGFLVGGLLLREYRDTGAIQPKRFLLRRGLKIWPAFYFLLLAQSLLGYHPVGTFLWQNALHVQNYFGTSIRQTWSLAIEEHFYLFLTFLLSFLAVRRASPEKLLAIMGGICLAAITLRAGTVLAGNLDGAFRWTQNRLDSLMFGVMIATLYHLKRDWYDAIAKQKILLAVAALTGFIFLTLTNPNEALMRTAGYTVLYIAFGALLILVYEHSGRMGDALIYRFIARIGVYSYGIYLWHTITLSPALKLAGKLRPSWQWPAAMLFQFVVSVAIGVILTLLIEWPFLRWRERHMGKQPSPIEPPLPNAEPASG